MSFPTNAIPVGGWQVTGQRQTQQLLPGSQNFVQGVEVTFITGYGVTASVFVPYTQFTPASVQQMIAARVAQLDAISSLTHASS